MSTVRNLPSKPAAPSDVKRPVREKSEPRTWSRWVRVLVSLLIVWHLFAVFIAPFSVPPTSMTIGRLAASDYVSWYTDPLYINHGYHFFAPDPGPSLISRYRVTGTDGEVLAEGMFPDLREHWPRLLYHRYLMLSDQSFTPHSPDSAEYAQSRTRFILQGYALHLLAEHQGDRARVELFRHILLNPSEVAAGRRLDDPATYESYMVVEQTVADLKRAEQRRSQLNETAASSGAVPSGGVP